MLVGWGMVVSTAAFDDIVALLRSEALVGRPTNLIVIDTIIYLSDSFALAERMKGDPLIAKTPIIVLTAHSQRGDGAAAQRHGIAGLLTKPFRQNQLAAMVSRILNTSNDPASSSQTKQLITRHVLRETLPQPAQRVLVVEDNIVNQKVTVRMLATLNLQADIAENGNEALIAHKHMAYAAILMDLQMPVMDGFTATAAIRAREGNQRHTPIIALTANALAGDRERCLAAGMDDYLPKPLHKSSLAAAMTRWLPKLPADDQPSATTVPSNSLNPDHTAILDPAMITQIRTLQAADGPDIMAEMSDLLLIEGAAAVRALHTALTVGDRKRIMRVAHRLRGSAATIGALALVQVCTTLEQKAQDGEINDSLPLIQLVEHELNRARQALEELQHGALGPPRP
jgi:CheY-like chemotaxis protein